MQNEDLIVWLWGYLVVAACEQTKHEFGHNQKHVLRAHLNLVRACTQNRLTVLNEWMNQHIETLSIATITPYVQHYVQLQGPMTGHQVVYFLQGYFELSQVSIESGYSRQQCQALMKEIQNIDGIDYPIWMLLKEIQHFIRTATTELDRYPTKHMFACIRGMFRFVIDPSHGLHPTKHAEMSKIHNEYLQHLVSVEQGSAPITTR
jgi:hypothetical protein